MSSLEDKLLESINKSDKVVNVAKKPAAKKPAAKKPAAKKPVAKNPTVKLASESQRVWPD
ncbi:hypothetical protein OAS07_05955 [Candidatus Thioglobus sp.]|nr:hypothetical protein [Candidatus Thioglobus sp.]MDC0888734.1 hypothetical protein [Candidatus Thioglobus sp.]MDC0965907.1 hypothetical protein [Candidatus Thioglobus sp.]